MKKITKRLSVLSNSFSLINKQHFLDFYFLEFIIFTLSRLVYKNTIIKLQINIFCVLLFQQTYLLPDLFNCQKIARRNHVHPARFNGIDPIFLYGCKQRVRVSLYKMRQIFRAHKNKIRILNKQVFSTDIPCG